MEVKGYKCFNKGLKGFMNMQFEVGEKYSLDAYEIVRYNSNGFHFCEYFEDTFTYFLKEARNRNIDLCEVIGSGTVLKHIDDYRELYSGCVCNQIEIIRKLSEEEIFEMGKQLQSFRLLRFIDCYKLTEEEIEELKEICQYDIRALEHIEYYQEGKKDVFTRRKVR